MKIRGVSEAIACYLGWDVADLRENRYHYGRTGTLQALWLCVLRMLPVMKSPKMDEKEIVLVVCECPSIKKPELGGSCIYIFFSGGHGLN